MTQIADIAANHPVFVVCHARTWTCAGDPFSQQQLTVSVDSVVPNLHPKLRPHEHIKNKFLFRWTLVDWFSRIVGGSLSAKPEFCASIIKDALEESESGLGLILSGLEDCVVGPMTETDLENELSRRHAEQLRARKEAATEALHFVLNETWPRLRVALLSHLPEPWVHQILGRTDIPCVYETPVIEPNDEDTWSEVDEIMFRRECDFDRSFAERFLHEAKSHDLNAKQAFARVQTQAWVSKMFTRSPKLRPLLNELELPNEGPGVPIDTGPLGGVRWHQLVRLYNTKFIRYTGEGFLGPAPYLQGVMK